MEDDTLGGRSAEADYTVGYKKPPMHSRFKKDQPRPPRRPKKEEPTSLELLANVLSETRVIKIAGKKLKMTNCEIILRRLVEKAPTSCRLQDLHYKLDAFLHPSKSNPEIFRVFISE